MIWVVMEFFSVLTQVAFLLLICLPYATVSCLDWNELLIHFPFLTFPGFIWPVTLLPGFLKYMSHHSPAYKSLGAPN